MRRPEQIGEHAMKIRIRRPRHATVVAYLALLSAIGGSAYAASKVGTSDLKSNAVTSPKISKGAIRAPDLKKLALRSGRTSVPGGTVSASNAVAECKKGERLISGGGGWGVRPVGEAPSLVASQPLNEGWIVKGNPSASTNTLIATAICMRK
jgi:hypothetical protein